MIEIWEIYRLPISNSQSFTDTAFLMLTTTMLVKLILTIESLVTEIADWVTLKTALIYRSWIVVSSSHVFMQFGVCVKLMFVGEDLLVPRAQVTDLLMMYALNVSMQVWPAQTSNITVSVRAIIPQQDKGIVSNAVVLVPDANVVIAARNIRF